MAFVIKGGDGAIYDLQTLLRSAQPEQGLSRDGIFGAETETALRAFQERKGLPVSGIADQETWEALKQEYFEREVYRAPAEPLLLILQPNQLIRKGERNLHLYLIQGMFLALGQLDADVPTVTVNGTLDTDTALALAWLQRLGGLSETGELDKNTWRFLAKQYRLMTGDGTGKIPIRRRGE